VTPTKVVTFDLDSTLASTYHRQHMIKPKGTDWEAYSLASAADTPIEGTVVLLRMLGATYPVHIITGRSDAAFDMTRYWLIQHGIPVDGLWMRPAGDRTPNGKYKIARILHLRESGQEPVLHVEDYPEAGDEIRAATGVPVLLVNPNYPKDAPHQNVMAGV
jgi:hypothetical protein